jgi:hypothetical protein
MKQETVSPDHRLRVYALALLLAMFISALHAGILFKARSEKGSASLRETDSLRNSKSERHSERRWCSNLHSVSRPEKTARVHSSERWH